MTANEPSLSNPIIFISHATSDSEIAAAFSDELKRIFGTAVSIFSTTSPGAIGPGDRWLDQIEQNLASARAVVVLITPLSIERPWIWWELGAAWLRTLNGSCHIYPLRVKEVDQATIPSPLDQLQVYLASASEDLKIFVQRLAANLEVKPALALRTTNITGRIPPYAKVKLRPVDQRERGFYGGRFEGYADEDLLEVIDAELLQPESEHLDRFLDPLAGRESSIFKGKLLHFREIDAKLQLPPGTAKRLLVQVAARYHLVPELLSDHVVRFREERG